MLQCEWLGHAQEHSNGNEMNALGLAVSSADLFRISCINFVRAECVSASVVCFFISRFSFSPTIWTV